uniref:Uncharacterized protein n=1 Tax=Anopheles atroparvus TaxID=41427 RepID=A0AAG5CNW4_ANOAO
MITFLFFPSVPNYQQWVDSARTVKATTERLGIFREFCATKLNTSSTLWCIPGKHITKFIILSASMLGLRDPPLGLKERLFLTSPRNCALLSRPGVFAANITKLRVSQMFHCLILLYDAIFDMKTGIFSAVISEHYVLGDFVL